MWLNQYYQLRARAGDALLASGHLQPIFSTRSPNMSTTPAPNDPAKAKPMLNEADIGSGERSPGQQETDRIIGEIPPRPRDKHPRHPDEEDGDDAGGRSDRS
jgi:hypothetical protein